MINEVADQRVERRPLVERSSPKASTSYTDYKDILRFDFFYSCAYCTMTECEARGITFEIDHYESKRARSDLIAEYSNLMWSCEECNGLKLDLIPPKKARADGYRFFRPDEDIYEDHFEPDGFRVAPKTNVGEFTIDGVRLNRLSLRRLRELRQRLFDCHAFIIEGVAGLRRTPIDRMPKELRARMGSAIQHASVVAESLADQIDKALRSLAHSELIDDDPEAMEELKQRAERLKERRAIYGGLWRGREFEVFPEKPKQENGDQ